MVRQDPKGIASTYKARLLTMLHMMKWYKKQVSLLTPATRDMVPSSNINAAFKTVPDACMARHGMHT